MKFCLLFNLSPCARYCLLIGSQLTTWSQGNLYVTLFSARSRIFLPIAQSCAALFCCRLAIRASSLGWLVGNEARSWDYCFMLVHYPFLSVKAVFIYTVRSPGLYQVRSPWSVVRSPCLKLTAFARLPSYQVCPWQY